MNRIAAVGNRADRALAVTGETVAVPRRVVSSHG